MQSIGMLCVFMLSVDILCVVYTECCLY
jgi:hypothetical protein